ncbi:MAG: excinuclease ABC subunit UvrC [Bacilli bacterium]|jgi:excinuclease ABC subunit C|nr:excinuclease ABC subunit UvrC [Bacilli bacterium]
MVLSEKLKRQIDLLPDKPGVYEMKDAADAIIYIGKAKSLKKRVSQYFLRPQSGKVFAMVSHVDHFDFIIVHTDKEAFILEMNLIQTHYPRYNVIMMDDSHYPYIALRRSDAFLKISRRSSDRRYFYFGPFPNATDAYRTIDLLNSLYPTRKCRTMPKRPCLYFHMGQCLAPCVNPIGEATYGNLYSSIKRFLDGDVVDAVKDLRAKMRKASDEERYEDAESYKETLEAVERTVSKQTVELSGDRVNRDVVAYAEREGYVALSVLTYRHGLLLGKKVKVVPSFGEVGEQLAELMEQYYRNVDLPSEILCKVPGFAEEFLGVYPTAVVKAPFEGRLLELIDLAALNARQGLDAHFMSARLDDDDLALLEGLGRLLGIKTPYRIELFDNSHLQGSNPVGAMVCYVNGEPAKGMYRKFHLERKDAGDDYHSMKEIVFRRYSRLKESGSSYPDLILADGGLIQVHACEEALGEAGVSIPVFGLRKNDRHQTDGLVDRNGNAFPLNGKSPLFFLLMRMQDEVHRFAISFHRAERRKAMHSDLFDGIKGLGERRKETIRQHYPTIDALKGASLEELRQFLPESVARSLFDEVRKR